MRAGQDLILKDLLTEETRAAREITATLTNTDGNPQHRGWENTVIGSIVLRVESNSVKRADATRKLLES